MQEQQPPAALQTHLDPQQLAPMLLVQNMVKLIKHLKLPVALKVSRMSRKFNQQLPGTSDNDATSSSQQNSVELAVVVHVLYDYVFKRYMQYCTASDLLLLRGLLLKVEVDAAYTSIKSVCVQQAFLPKFENEMEDSKVAAEIVQEATVRPMLITIKHSGSLVTLSSAGFAAKNSVNNEFTAGAALLMQTHYQRLLGPEQGLKKMQEFMRALQEQKLAVSFEMVTGSHGHHGQVPQGEYLVTTSAHTISSSGEPSFLPWKQFLALCLSWSLPLNDTWLLQGTAAAGAARELLDHLALSGCTTAEALQQLNSLVQQQDSQQHGQSAAGGTCLYFPGTYPHDEWQGSRLEGFVVSQGQPVPNSGVVQELLQLSEQMSKQVIKLETVQQELRKPYQQMLQEAGSDVAATQAAVLRTCRRWLPDVAYEPLDVLHRNVISDLLENFPVPLADGTALHMPDGQTLHSRAALEKLTTEELQKLLQLNEADAGCVAEASQEQLVLQAMLALSGQQSTAHAVLRYKKKMLMWSDKEVGYMMMTMGIRNGLTALKVGQDSYLTALAATARHAWGLPEALVGKVMHFGRCWARWILRHGGVASVNSDTYLDAAEAFVRDFLAGLVDKGWEQRPAGAFQGVVVALDASGRFVQQLQKAMRLQHILQPSSGDLVFSTSLVQEGTCLWLPHDSKGALKKNKLLVEFLKAAAPHVYYIEQPPRDSSSPDAPQAKRIVGQHRSKVEELKRLLTDSGRITREQLEQRTVLLPKLLAAGQSTPAKLAASNKATSSKPAEEGKDMQEQKPEDDNIDAEYEATNEHIAAEVQSVVIKFGAGSPPADQDPAVIICFVTIPGIGKSALLSELGTLTANNSSSDNSSSNSSVSRFTNTTVAVLNGDTLRTKQGITGMRYWHQVSGAADSCQGGGHCMLILADKNLVPAPRDNIQRVTDIIRRSGATTVAVLPICTTQPPAESGALIPENNQAIAAPQQQQQQSILALPFPLELVALCMLRVLQRQSHEGGLDANTKSAMSVVLQFVSYFRGLSTQQLRQQLQSCFDHVVELPVATLGQDQQVPAAVLNHISDGLSLILSNPSSDPPLPPEWDTHMCQLLQDPGTQAAVAAIALPWQDCVTHLQTCIAAVIGRSRPLAATKQQHGNVCNAAAAGNLHSTGISGSLGELDISGHNAPSVTAGTSAAAAAGGAADFSVRYIAVAVENGDQLRQQLQELLVDALKRHMQQQQQQQQPQQQPPSGAGDLPDQQKQQPAIKSDLHVTLWHRDDDLVPAAAAAESVQQCDELLAVAGHEVQMQLVAVDISPQVTAAQVELLHGPDVVTSHWNQLFYPHITLSVAKGFRAVDSNQLPSRVADDSDVAYRVHLEKPLLISGQVLPYQ